MQTLRRTVGALIFPAIAYLGVACERTDTPTGVPPKPVMQMADPAPSRTWTNDFEKPGDDTPAGGWYPNPPATITRTPSGAAATYASGIQSASGSWHARLRPNVDPCPKVQVSDACSGPYTFWGKSSTALNPVFPDGGYVTEIDIYLDVAWMTTASATRYDTRFDWTSSIDDQFGGFRRDFVFNAGTPLTPTEAASSPGYYVNASTNSFRSGAFPENMCPNPSTAPNYCRTPVKIDESGWYIFQHYFHLTTIGSTTYLAVDMSVRRLNGSIVASWTIYDQEDAFGFGGDAYGWFVINEIQDLAADCSTLHPPGKTPSGRSCPLPPPSSATGGGQVPVNPVNPTGGKGSFGFNAKSDGGVGSGHLNYLNHVTGAHLDCTVSAVTITPPTADFSGTCSANSDATSFMAHVEDHGNPGKGNDVFTITYNMMTEGGMLTSGNIEIH